MPRHPFQKLRDKMTPAQRARSDALVHEMMEEMLLSEIRRLEGKTQEEVAETMGIQQPSLSKLESQDDIQVSTLRRLIEALGGKLEIIAHLPRGDVRISQFKAAS